VRPPGFFINKDVLKGRTGPRNGADRQGQLPEGSSRREQVRENAKAAGVKLEDTLTRQIDEILDPVIELSGAALLTGGQSSRWSGPISVRALVTYGVPAVFSLYPSAVVSNAVAHIVAVEDGFGYHDWLARPLLMSGFVPLAAALISGMLAHKR
jgi:hypothetical protein